MTTIISVVTVSFHIAFVLRSVYVGRREEGVWTCHPAVKMPPPPPPPPWWYGLSVVCHSCGHVLLSACCGFRVLTYTNPAHESTPGNAGVHHRNVVSQLGLEHAVEVLASSDGAQCVAVGELGEHSDLVRVLKLCAGGHSAVKAIHRRGYRLSLLVVWMFDPRLIGFGWRVTP